MARFLEGVSAALGDRRLQVGAAATLGALAVCGLAVAGAGRIGGEATRPDMADHARLAILVQPIRPGAVPYAMDRLATLDPAQADTARPAAPPVDPALQAMVNRERRETALAVAEQRAFDVRIRAEMNGSYRSDVYRDDGYRVSPPRPQSDEDRPSRTDPPVRRGWTSNTETETDDGDPGV